MGTVGFGLVRSYRTSRNVSDLFLLGQMVFWMSAMATDYVLDLPFHRLAFFLLIACAIASRERPTITAAEPGHFPIWARNVCVAVTAGSALLSTVLAVSALRLAHDNAVMMKLYLQALESTGVERPQLLRRAASHGGSLLGTAVHSKTRYKDWQVLADIYRRLGHKDAARHCAKRALELHPYSPKTFRLLAKLHTGEQRRQWSEGYDYIRHQATSGYRLPYPTVINP